MFLAAFIFSSLFIFNESIQASSLVPICDRRPVVRDMIVAAYGKPCDQLTPEYLSNRYVWATLEIRNTLLTEIQPYDFQGLQLNDLRIAENTLLTSIAHDAFADVHVEGNLVLRGNPVLTQIDYLAFQNIVIPESPFYDHVLEISNNPSLKILTKQAFSNIEGLGAIRIISNPSLEKIEGLAFSNIQSDSRAYPTNYKMNVEISDNPSLKTLAPGFLNEVSLIKKLIIANNPSLQTLPTQMISNCGYADDQPTIEIRDNTALTSLEPGFLSLLYMNAPAVVLTGNNSLKTIKANTFANTRFSSIQILNNPSLLSIDADAFHNLQVGAIIISGNPSLTSIAPHFISGLKFIRSVEISNNDALVEIQPETFQAVVSNQSGQYMTPWTLSIHGNQSLTVLHTNAIHEVLNLGQLYITENPALVLLEKAFIGDLTYTTEVGSRGLDFRLSKNANLVRLPRGSLSAFKVPMTNVEISQNDKLVAIEEGAIDLYFIDENGQFKLTDNPSLFKLNTNSLTLNNLHTIRISGNATLQAIESGAIYGQFGKVEGELFIEQNPALTSIQAEFAILSKLTQLEIQGNGQVTDFDVLTLRKMAPTAFITDTTLVQNMKGKYALPQVTLARLIMTDWPLPQSLFSNTGLSFRLLGIQGCDIGEVAANSFTMDKLALYSPLETLDLSFANIRGPVEKGAFNGVGDVIGRDLR
jgi:hypothetical protein